MRNFIEEFKAFAMKGNVLELAVAVVIGTAFGKIVSSLVDNIIMPLMGMILGGVDLTRFAFAVGNSSITYGVFLQRVVDFLIVALVIFLVIKTVNHSQWFGKKEEQAKDTKPAEPPEDIKLLREIRDLLRNSN